MDQSKGMKLLGYESKGKALSRMRKKMKRNSRLSDVCKVNTLVLKASDLLG